VLVQVEFEKPVDAKGNIEVWLQRLVDGMQDTVKQVRLLCKLAQLRCSATCTVCSGKSRAAPIDECVHAAVLGQICNLPALLNVLYAVCAGHQACCAQRV
jgi:hypothetical protein